MLDGTGSTIYTYDALNRPISIAQPNGTINYGYDAVNRTSLTLPGSLTTSFAYDITDHMTSVTDWASHTTSYGYDNAGRLLTTTYPNGVVSTNTYDNADRLTGISTVKGATNIVSITYTLDNVGNRMSMVEPSGTTGYTYDGLNRLTGVTYPTGAPASVSYTYDAMGNRQTMVLDGVTTNYNYDAVDRLTSTTGGSNLTFTWDNNGQMLSKGSQTFTWDALGRMTGLTNGGTTASYGYNGDGVRVQKVVNSIETDDLQDLSAGLPVVMAETSGANTTQNVYGTDMIAQVNGSVSNYYHADGLGSTRAMTDSTGLATDQYTYDAFGATRSHTGSGAQTYTFTGQQADPEAGLVFLRARYYDPETGRFVSKDPFPSLFASARLSNKYIYASNNPINYVDLAGLLTTYIQGRVAAIFGIGTALQLGIYTDTQSGNSRLVGSIGSGAGIGLSASEESGISTDGLPDNGTNIQVQGDAKLGVDVGDISAQQDLTTGVTTGCYGVAVKACASDNRTAQFSASAGVGVEASATINQQFVIASWRGGALGDWLFDQFVQPFYDIQYYQAQAEYYRARTEIIHRRNTAGGENYGIPPSKGK